jgi:predicted MFS family arabinose efflux permease
MGKAPEDGQRTGDRLLTREFVILLATVACFGLSWSFYLILPKFLATELSLDAAGIGRVVATQGLAAVAATPAVGWLVDRFGRRTWIVGGNLMLAATGIGYLFVDRDGLLLYVVQAAWGVGMVMTFNAAGTLTADVAPANRMAQAIGLFGAANLGTNAISPAVGEVIANQAGWSFVFVASATMALIAAVLALFVHEPERSPIASEGPSRPLLGWPLLRVYLATFAFTAGFTALFILHQPFALGRGVTEVREFFIAFAVVALTVRLGGGRTIDRIGVLRSAIAALSLYALVPPLLGMMGAGHLWFIGAAMGLAHGVAYPAVTALAIERADVRAKGMVVSIVHGSFNGGHAVFAYTLGWLAEVLGYSTTFWIAGVVTLGGAVLLTPLRVGGPGALARLGSTPRLR